MKQKFTLSLALLALTFSQASFANTPTAATIEQAVAKPTVEVSQQGKLTTVVSPRTGISYTLSNATTRDIIFKAEAIEVANATTAQRIVATNPAISPESQQQAQQNLLKLVGAVQ